MKENIILWLISLSVLLHTPWELFQANWLANCRNKPWYIKLRNCSVGIILDTLYTIGLYYLFSYFKNSEVWLLHAGVNEYALILIISVLVAYASEWLALKSGVWKFHKNTPRLPKPLGNIPLLPLIQLPLLVFLTFFITQFILS
jgi:hypothetical protein